MLTEEEAKTKWCPHVRSDRHGSVCNRDYDGEVLAQHCCIGSACMAWRGGDAPREQMRNYHDTPTIAHRHESGLGRVYEGGWQYNHTDTDHDGRKFDLLHRVAADDAPRHGYCGLAGKAGA